MSNRYFRLDFNGSGGQICIGAVTHDFYTYWLDKDQDDLLTHLFGMQQGDGDSRSPTIFEHGNASSIHDVSDLVNVTGPYDDNGYWVTEVEPHNSEAFDPERSFLVNDFEEVGDSIHYGFGKVVYHREAFSNFYSDDEYIEDALLLKPTLAWHSSEKGNFGTAWIETQDDFDPSLFAIGVIETSVASIVEAGWYKKKSVNIGFEFSDTVRKYTSCHVGLIYEPWFQSTVSEAEIRETLCNIYRDND